MRKKHFITGPFHTSQYEIWQC